MSREVVSAPNLAGALTPQRLHAELLETSASGARSYLFGATHDATISSRHGTVRFGQADVEWLNVLRLLLKERGQKAWMYREGSTRSFWVLENVGADGWRIGPPALRRKSVVPVYARGYFDAEGGIPRNVAARFYIQFVQKDRSRYSRPADDPRRRGDCLWEVAPAEPRYRPSGLAVLCCSCLAAGFRVPRGLWHRRKRGLLVARFGEAGDQDEDIVHAPWRHGEPREQGSRSGSCGWITSFLGST